MNESTAPSHTTRVEPGPEPTVGAVTPPVGPRRAPAPDGDVLADLFEQAVRLVTRWLPGVSSAGVTVVFDDAPVTAASTAPQVLAVDRLQYDLGDGPCLTALRTASVVSVDAGQAEDRWPAFALQARAHGVRSYLAAPLVVAGVARGAINLYSELEDGFAGHDAELVDVFSRHVSRGYADYTELRSARDQVAHLQTAIAGRAPIEQAKGILMAVHQISDSAAFELLRTQSQVSNTKLRDLAASFVTAQTNQPTTAPTTPPTAPAAAGSGALDFQSAFDHALIGMAIADPDGVLLTVNPVLAQLLGRDPAALVGTTLFEVTHPDDVSAAQEACAALREGPELTKVLGVRFRTAGGGWVPVTVSTAKVLAGDGQAAHLVMHVEDVSEHHTLTDQLRHQAMHDPLTGLPNRVLFLDRLTHAAARHTRSGGTLAVVFCDVNQFKAVNDTHGHHTGDVVLQTLADRLRRVLRPGDTAARLGGDEFVVLCEDTDADTGDPIAERIRAELGRALEVDGDHIDVSVSVGVATTNPTQDLSPFALLRAADAAMYADKTRWSAQQH